MAKEYAVMYPRISDTEIHREPYPTREEAQDWIDEVEDDGFTPGIFEIWERPVAEWRKSDER